MQEAVADTVQSEITDVNVADEPEVVVDQVNLDSLDLASQELIQLSQVWQDYKVLNQQVLAYSELNSNVKAQALSRDGSRRAYDALQVILTEEISLADQKRTISSGDLVQAQSNLKLALGLQAAFSDMSIKVRDYLANGKGSWKCLKSDFKRLDKKVQNLAKSEANMKMFVNAVLTIWADVYTEAKLASDGDTFLNALCYPTKNVYQCVHIDGCPNYYLLFAFAHLNPH